MRDANFSRTVPLRMSHDGLVVRGQWTLVLEASTASGSVALLENDHVRQTVAVAMGASREDALFPAVQTVLAAEQISPRDLSAIVCGSGPGSFTSLRIAAAIAKGLAQATNVPLFAVPSLLLAAASHDAAGDYLVHSDALRGERYAMTVHIDDARCVRADSAVTRETLDDLVMRAKSTTPMLQLLAVASGAIGAVRETEIDGGPTVVPNAAHLPRVAGWRDIGAVSLDEWEPAYGRLAEAQVKWEIAHARPLPSV